MINHDQFAISLLSLCLMKQRATQNDLEAMLDSLAERMEAVNDQHQHTDNSFMEQREALGHMNAQLLSLTQRVEAGGAKQQGTDFTIGVAAVCLMQHKDALEQVCAVVRDLMDRVDAMEHLQRQISRTHRAEGSPNQRAAKKTRHKARQKPSPRKHGRKRA